MQTVNELRDSICIEMNYWQIEWCPTQGEMGVVISLIEKAVAPLNPAGGSAAARHRLFAYLFGEYMNDKRPALSAHDLPSEVWFALVRWAQPYKDDVDGWVSGNPDFETQAMYLSKHVDEEFLRKEKEILDGLGY